MQISDIKAEKIRLRKEFKAKRKLLSDVEKQRSDGLIYKNIISLKEYKAADTIFTYVSADDECDTIGIIKYALTDKKYVAVPKCKNECEMDFYYINSLDDLELGMYGLLEPKHGLVKANRLTGLCLVPGLCFDKFGIRLGYGKGYYDRFLPQFNGVSAGVCRADYYIDKLPCYQTDCAVDLIVTEKNVYITDKRRNK